MLTKKTSPKSPRKQRRRIHKSPLHTHKNMLRCRLDEFLQEEYGFRSLLVKKGDLVRVMRGQFREIEGKVTRVDYSAVRVYIDAASITKADGKEAPIPLHPSNLKIVKLELDDERKKRIEQKMIESVEAE